MACTVSLQGDAAYKDAIKKLAHRHKTTVAALVRKLFDEKYGAELASIMAKKFAESDAKKHQMITNNKGEASQS